MTVRTHLVLVSLLAAALAGCLGGDADDAATPQDTNQTGSGGPGPSEPQDPSPGAAPDAPPVAVLKILGPDVVVNASENGTSYEVAAQANVTLDASESSDPADGNLTISWQLGDGASADGVLVNHSWSEPGEYIVVLTVTSDASGLSDTAEARLVVSEAQAAVEVPEPIAFQGTITGAWVPQAGYLPDYNSHSFELDVVVQRIVVSIAFGGTALDLDYAVRTPSGQTAGSQANYNEPTGTVFDAGEPDIVVENPDHLAQLGTWEIRVNPGISVEGDYTVTVTFE